MTQDSDLKASRDRFVAMSFAAADLLLEVNPDTGAIAFAMGAPQAITGFSQQDLMKQSLYSFFYASDRLLIAKKLQGLKEGDRMRPFLMRLIREGQESVPVIIGACRLPDHPNFYVSLIQAESILLQHMPGVEHKDLSGLFDRYSFLQKAEQILVASRDRDIEYRMTLLVLEGQQALLQQWGQEQVDKFYNSIGAYLRAVSVDGDTASEVDNNKYAVIHSETVSHTEISSYIKGLGPESQANSEIITVTSKSVEMDIESLANNDIAKGLLCCLDTFHENGLQGFEILSLSGGLNRIMQETINRVTNLKATGGAKAFDLVFQPIVNLHDEKISHYDVLSRFKGNKPTFQVVNFAEEVGLVQEFDLAVCQKVIDTLLDLQKTGKTPTLAVNISAQSLESSVFVDAVRKLLQPHEKLCSQIMFELTESTTVSNLEMVNNVLQQLRRDGHRVCLDDVGAGGTSFKYMRALFVDFVKIDGSYIQRLLEEERDASFIRAMGILSRELHCEAIAEHVERQGQADCLRTLGINFGQGWLYGKPSPLFETFDKAQDLNGKEKDATTEGDDA